VLLLVLLLLPPTLVLPPLVPPPAAGVPPRPAPERRKVLLGHLEVVPLRAAGALRELAARGTAHAGRGAVGGLYAGGGGGGGAGEGGEVGEVEACGG
jgi:hypothetical protein